MAGKILVVEESATQAARLRHVLEEAGYTVSVATTAAQGLSMARADPPTIILSDIVLPEMDGYAFCKAIRADTALHETPVVLITALAGPEHIIRALDCGADSFIRKPYDEQHLLSRLRYIQSSRELRKTEKTHLGLEIELFGQRHVIRADRHQILDLLISSFQDLIGLNEELSAQQVELRPAARFLQGLNRIAEGLNGASSEEQVAQVSVSLALTLTGVEAAWMSLRDLEGGFRIAAVRGLPPELATAEFWEGDCLCRRSLLSGELSVAANILECERLKRARVDAGAPRYHASIPLWVSDRTLGVLNLAGTRPGLFAEEDLQILSGVGNQVAIALERARLLAHLEGELSKRGRALYSQTVARHQAEETRRRLIEVLEATTDMVAMADAEQRVTYCNRGGRRMLGIGEDEDISTIRLADVHPELAKRIVLGEGIPTAIRDGIWSGETALTGRDGREIPVSQVIVAHKTAEGDVDFLSTIARDISERKRTEEALRESGKLAAMSEVLAGVAHELNNPLAVVSGHAALLRKTAESESVIARAGKIARAAERCARIVRNFLSLARRYPSERTEVDVNRIIKDVDELLVYSLRLENIEVVFDLADDLPIVSADPHQLHQVAVNLIANAQHAMRHGTGRRRLTLVTRFDRQDHQVRLAVADTGPGIPYEVQGRIFEPFFTTKPPGEGTGLGLSLCRGILEEHGGAIRVESSPGSGATFFVTLPIGEPRVGAPQAALPEPLARITGKVVLVVDDEPELANLLAEMLSSDGHEVDVAANGSEALAKSRQRAYDLIFSDVRMPDLDGPGFYLRLTQEHPELRGRFGFVTGDTLSHETKAFLESTGAPSLNKPFTLEEVRRMAQRLLRSP